MSSSKIILKNTLLLYFRMFLIMGVTLFTSRIVLLQLGVSDYGIYSLVGGIVTMLGFFNSAMSSATQRYLSFDIGKGDKIKLQKTFSATLTIHFLIALLALILAETFGLWYINSKMVFPEGRLYAVNIVYQFSVLTFILTIIQVPYNALIIAKEHMNIYAYVSIVEVCLKLVIVYLLSMSDDKLVLYSILIFIVTFLIRTIYKIYCNIKFKESKYKFEINKQYFGELLSYSGWNLFGNFAGVARGQGVNIVLNLFFGTVVNAAYGITLQVQNAVQMFVGNFQMAVNPQIIKMYAKNEEKSMLKLVFQSSKFSFLLIMLLVVPIVFNMEMILNIWLGDVPKYSSVFCIIALLTVLVDSLSGSLMTGTQATGVIKWYQVVVGSLIFLNLPISYICLKFYGLEPDVVFKVSFVISIISLVFRVYFLKRLVFFKYKDFLRLVIFPAVGVLSISLMFYSFVIHEVRGDFLGIIIETVEYIFVSLVLIYFIGMRKEEREFIKELLNKFKGDK